MDLRCKYYTHCEKCLMEACPFGRNGQPNPSQYNEGARLYCRRYEPRKENG